MDNTQIGSLLRDRLDIPPALRDAVAWAGHYQIAVGLGLTVAALVMLGQDTLRLRRWRREAHDLDVQDPIDRGARM